MADECERICRICNLTYPMNYFPRYMARGEEIFRYRLYCKACDKHRKDVWREKNKDRHRKRTAEWAANNPDKRKLSNKKWRENNLEKCRLMGKSWRERNPNKARLDCSVRRRRVREATPKWVSEGDLQLIKCVYSTSLLISRLTGIPHHVDHVVPLKGKNVCGLHVINNLQVIPRSDNLRKNNYYSG